MSNIHQNRIAVLGIDWFAPSLYYGCLVAFFVYGFMRFDTALFDVVDWRVAAFIIVLLHTLLTVSETKFILTENELIVKKPFLPILLDKTFPLESISMVECQYRTGKTLQPAIFLHFKTGKWIDWFTGASSNRVKMFLAEVERMGINIKFSGNKPDVNS